VSVRAARPDLAERLMALLTDAGAAPLRVAGGFE
jgi:hypothetical protein